MVRAAFAVVTNGMRPKRYRSLVLCQIALIVASLSAPIGASAVDPGSVLPADQPSSAANPDSGASRSSGQPSDPPAAEPTTPPTTDPSAERSAEPSLEPGVVPSLQPSAAPSTDLPVEPSPGPSAAPEPSASFDTDDYIVTFASGTSLSRRSSILAAAGADVVDTIAPLRLAIVRVPGGSPIIDRLRGDGNVVRVERDRVRSAGAAPSDPGYADQWSLPAIGWDTVYRSARPVGSAVVAVLDTGVDASHPDLAGRLVPGTSLLAGTGPTVDPNGHGTAMAGIIAADTDNGIDIAGIGFDGVKVMPITVLDADGLGQDSDIIEGIVWAVDHGADVINLSFSNPGYSAALQAAIDYAWASDAVVVAATGNDGSSAPAYPAGDRGVVGVSNTDRADALNSSSNHGADTFLAAPGTDIRTLAAGGGTLSVTGTSASSAEVAGAAAMLRAIDPDASNAVIVGRLARSAAAVGTREETGNGRLDLARAAGDDGTSPVTPSGAGPSADGGPFVGPYVAAIASVNATTTLDGSTGSINVAPGASITLVMSVTTTGAGTAHDWNSSRWAFGTSAPAPGAMTCVDHANHSGPGTFSETITITAPAVAGTYNLYLYAYNGDGCATGQSTQFVRTGALDQVAPTVTIDQAVAQVDPTRTSPITFTVVFSEPVTGFATGDVSFSGTAGGAMTGTVTGGPTTYTVAVTGMTTPGTVIASIAAGVASDPAGNGNVASSSTDDTVTWDNVAPTVTINQAAGQPDPTNTSPISYTVVFSEPVTGFVTGDVTFAGTAGGAKTGTVSGGPTTYTVAVTGMTTSGTVIATIAASRATDLAGNNNTASTSTDNTVTWDVTAPTVTINQAAGQPDPTNTSPITFTVVFSEPVTGFATGDVTFAGTAGGAMTGTVSGGPTTYTVAVTGMTTSGTVIATIAAGIATDLAGNANVASTSADNTVTWDVVAPTVTIDQAVAQVDPTRTSPITFTVVFSEPVTGFATGDVSFSGTAGGAMTGTVTGGPTTYTVAVTGMTTPGTVIASIAAGVASDPAGNGNVASSSTDDTVTWDNVAPTVTINQAAGQPDPTNTSPISYTVVFSEPVTGFVTGDVTFAGTAGGAKTGTVSGGPTTYTVAVTGMTTSGTVIATIAASRATDLAGNNNTASTSTDNTVTWDVTAPTVTINQAAGQPDPTNTSPITFTVVFSEPVTGFATGDVTFAGTAGGAMTGTVSGGPTTYTVAVTGMTTSGTVIATIAAGIATDLAGNANVASTSADNTVTWDVVAPTVTIDLRPGSDSGSSNTDDLTNAASLVYDITFSESVVGVALADFSTTGSTAIGCTIGTLTGAGAAYSVTLTGCGNGTVVLNFAANGATDTAGNTGPTSIASLTVTVDRVAPTVTINQAAGQPDPTNTSPISYTVVFSEPVTGFVTGDVTFAGTAGGAKTGTVSGGPTTYTVAVTGMTTSGTVIATIAASRATDLAGNNNTASTSTDNTVTWDVTAPTVTINQAAGQPDPTNTSPITFTVVFSEPVTGFATGDVTFAGTAGGAKTGTVSGGPTTYTVAVTGMTTSGTVIATIAAGIATDLAGNANVASTSADNTVTWDVVAPTVTIDLRPGSDSGSSNTDDLTNAASLVYDITFSESVVGVALADFSTTGSTAIGCTIGTLTGAGAAYSVTLTGCGNGTVVLNFAANGATDTAGNTGPTSIASLTVTVDRVAPTVTINQAAGQPDPTNTSPISYTVVFSEPVTGFVTGDVTFAGTAGGAKTGTVSGGPTTYTVAVTGMTTSGTVIATIAASRATDLAGNNNTASTSTDNTVTWDVTAPTVTINQAAGQPDPTNTSPITFTVVFSEPVTGFATGDVTFAGTAGGAMTGTVSGGPTTYTVAVTGMTTSGTVIATIAAGIATDLAGNANVASTSADNTVTWDRATHVGFVQQPTDTVYRSTIGPAVTVAILDASDQVVTESGASVSLTLVPSGPTLGGTLAVVVVNGIATFSNLSVDHVGSYTLAATSAGLIGTTSTTFEILPAALTVTADDRTKTYGQTVTFAGTEFTVSGLLGTDTLTSVSLASAGAPAPAPVAGSPYPITPSAAVGTGLANYAITYVDGRLTVDPAPLTITADDRTKTYGQTVTFAGTEFTVSGLLGTDTLTSVSLASAGAPAPAPVAGSPYPITPSAALGTGVGNYTITYVDGELTVDRADPVIVVTGYTVTYDGLPHTAAGTASGVFGEDLSADLDLSATTHTTVGATNDPWTFTDSTGNYTDDAGTVDNEILPAALTITADDRTKTYGQTVTFAGTEFTVSGLLGTDTLTSVSLASAGAPAPAPVAGSPYPITPSAAVGTGLANYAITYVDGRLTVDPAPLTITADDRTKTYGQTVTFAGTEFTVSGLLGTDTLTSVSLASAGAPAPAPVAGSPYPITPSAALGTGVGNYTITYVDGELTVDRADPVIVVTGYTVTYDGLPHTAAGTASGVFGEDLSADLDLSATTHTTVGATNDPWTFTDSTGNYTDDAGTVDNEILPAALTITADDRTKTYGQTVTFAGTEFTVSGLLGTDTLTSVSLASAGAPAPAPVAGSPYPITPSAAVGTGLANYAITYVDGRLTVDPAPLTITADDQSKPSGAIFVFAGTEFTTTSMVGGDMVTSATITSAGASAAAPPGGYPIGISAAVGAGLANYTITYVDGTMTVGNTTPTIGDADVQTTATTAVSGSVTVSDPDTGQTVKLSISSGPTNGTAMVADDGSFTYTPTGNFTGIDTFTIEGCDDAAVRACASGTVTVAIYPVAVDDAQVTGPGETIEVDVQANDIGDTGPLQIVTGPAHGTATIGSIIYTANADFTGTDTVVYRVCSPNAPSLCDDATLTIMVARSVAPQTDTDSIATRLGPSDRTNPLPLTIVLLLVLAAGGGAAVLFARGRRSDD